ncbi:hypothetical protein JOD45_001058 [Scopulibacillus daqui]|uniref:D-Ala-teichoic acid biosynthesis protein n=1 Tax=Scopulibacillus daqui TaxID=1469162 RepID=A0ABS2PXS2_9BACL|nr:teichoic acid D-Ala incorporation-associated protein DltX [Scopulibacillus daqui]MBM7644851.1 hypothetical protein [Scopulibacillus daqui]
MKTIQKLWSRPVTQWFIKTLYYLVIIVALVWLYGAKATHSSPFIYNEF